MSSPAEPQRTTNPLLLWSALAAVVVVGIWQAHQFLNDPSILPPDDYTEYWAAGRLNAFGENPMDPKRIHELQAEAGRFRDDPVLMWNPPWTLTLAMPLGLLPPRLGQLIWLFLNFGIVLFCADWAWRFYGGPADRRWIAWAVCLTFLPTLFVLKFGQISAFILLGVVGFLHFERQGRYVLAGMAAALMGIKPHLVYLFWIALVLWTVSPFRRGAQGSASRWGVILGGLATGLAACVPPLLTNPQVFNQYWYAFKHYPPEQYVSLTMGTGLRVLFGSIESSGDIIPGPFWLQYVPLALGLAWLAWHWAQERQEWDWGEQFPLLLLVSFLTCAYGAWHFDLVLLLLPVVQAAVWCWRGERRVAMLGVAIFVMVNALALYISLIELGSIWFVWIAPVLLVAYLVLRRQAHEFPSPLPLSHEGRG